MVGRWTKRSFLSRALRLALVSCAILAGGLVIAGAHALASAGKRPVIGSMGSGAGGEITISAHIDPENLETSYELRLECGPEEPMACDELPNERTQGRLPPVEESREVSMTVTGLKPGKYWFGVSAVNADGEASWSSDILTVKLNCLGIESCHGKLTLTAQGTAKAKGSKRARAVTIGTVSFSIAGDETKTVKVELDAPGRMLLKADHGRCDASLEILELAPGAENTQGETARLVQAKAAKAKRR